MRVTHSFLPVDAQSLTAAFAGSDSSSEAMQVTGLHEGGFTTLALGLNLQKTTHTDVQVSYDTRLGDVTQNSALSAKFSLHV